MSGGWIIVDDLPPYPLWYANDWRLPRQALTLDALIDPPCKAALLSSSALYFDCPDNPEPHPFNPSMAARRWGKTETMRQALERAGLA